MTREFIYYDIGEFGFNQFYEYKDDKWVWVDLEVDCDPETLENFRNNDQLNFQFWVNEDKRQLCIASNCLGHKRQANVPMTMLNSCKLTFVKPAKGPAEFDLSIDSNVYRGEVIRGQINVISRGNGNWDINDFGNKSKMLEEKIDILMRLTGGQITKREKFINA